MIEVAISARVAISKMKSKGIEPAFWQATEGAWENFLLGSDLKIDYNTTQKNQLTVLGYLHDIPVYLELDVPELKNGDYILLVAVDYKDVIKVFV